MSSKKTNAGKRPLKPARRQILTALKNESEVEMPGLIRRRLALPIEPRMHFLHVRPPGGGSAL